MTALSAAALLLGACGGSSKSTPASAQKPSDRGSKNTGSSTDACTFVNKDDASTLFGVAATQGKDVAADYGNDASSCIWQADDTESHSYLLQIRIYNDEAHYGGAVMDKTEPVSGLGDKAFVRKEDGIRGVDVQFVRGGKTYAVNYGITNVLAKTKKNASEQADQLVALVKSNTSRL